MATSEGSGALVAITADTARELVPGRRGTGGRETVGLGLGVPHMLHFGQEKTTSFPHLGQSQVGVLVLIVVLLDELVERAPARF